MAVQQYIDILMRRIWIIVLTTLITFMVAAVGSYLQRPIYSASVTARVAQASTGGSVDYAEYVYADRLLQTYGEILKSRPFLEETLARLKVAETPEALADRVTVKVILNTELIRIIVEDQSPAQSAAIANMLASLLVERSQSLFFGGTKSAREIVEKQMNAAEANLQRNRTALQIALAASPRPQETIDALTSEVKLGEEIYASLLTQYEQVRLSEASRANSVTVSEPAVVPKKPSKPRTTLNLALGLLVGLLAGLALAFLSESLDPTLHTIGDLEAAAHLPVLGLLPMTGGLRSRRQRVVFSNPKANPALVEAYRMVRTRILSLAADSPPRSLLVTSPEAGTGKSTVSANLGVAIAQTGRRVVIVDADLRRSSQHEIFGLPNRTGLSSVLQRETSLETALQETEYQNLRVLTAGPQPTSPAELLGSEVAAEVIRGLNSLADLVLVDSPPILAVTDGAALLPCVDSILLVTARDQTTSRRVQAACQLVEKLGGTITGTIFNRAQGDERYYYYQYSYGGPAYARYRARRRQTRLILILVGVLLTLLVVLTSAVLIWRPPWLQNWPMIATLVTHRPALPSTEPEPSPSGIWQAEASSMGTPAFSTPAPVQGTAAPALPGAHTATPLLPRPASIASAERGLRDGVFLYQDPVTAVPSTAWLQAGTPVEVLEVDVYGRVLYGSPRWYQIRCSLGGRTYTGYVPATLVTWTP
jgi:capsular exopolysaccharide synthesis family protein